MNNIVPAFVALMILMVGAIALVMLPIRIIGVAGLYKAWRKMSALDHLLTLLSSLVLLPTILLWFFVVFAVIAMILDLTRERLFGLSEVGMITTLFVIPYLLFEGLLLIPRKHLKKKETNAEPAV